MIEGRTSFVIAHRLSTIKESDLILVMNSGNVVESRIHDELLRKNGYYANSITVSLQHLKSTCCIIMSIAAAYKKHRTSAA